MQAKCSASINLTKHFLTLTLCLKMFINNKKKDSDTRLRTCVHVLQINIVIFNDLTTSYLFPMNGKKIFRISEMMAPPPISPHQYLHQHPTTLSLSLCLSLSLSLSLQLSLSRLTLLLSPFLTTSGRARKSPTMVAKLDGIIYKYATQTKVRLLWLFGEITKLIFSHLLEIYANERNTVLSMMLNTFIFENFRQKRENEYQLIQSVYDTLFENIAVDYWILNISAMIAGAF